MAAWVFLLRTSLPHQANFSSVAPLPPPWLPAPPEPGAQAVSPAAAAAAASPPITNWRLLIAMSSPRRW